MEKCLEAENIRDTVQTQIKRVRYDGEVIWLDTRIRFIGNKGKRKNVLLLHYGCDQN